MCLIPVAHEIAVKPSLATRNPKRPKRKNGSQVLLPFLPTKRRCFVSPLLNVHILNRPIQLAGRIPCLDRQDLGAWIGRDFLIERGAG